MAILGEDDGLWNEEALDVLYQEDAKSYQSAIMQQYELYVEMADRVSQRRGLANTFFLSLNTTIFTLVGVFWGSRTVTANWWLVFPVIALVGQCGAWFYIVRSYRLLNSAKFRVVGELEERLPASPFWLAEWRLLGQGSDPHKYWPLSHIEKWIPILFAGTYLTAAVVVISTGG